MPPTCYLDDTTTKNVIIHSGALSGIVDVDSVSFGDPLLTVGLTQTALLAEGFDLDYVHTWTALMHLNQPQKEALQFYTMLYCVVFMSEVGQRFNRKNPRDAGYTRLQRLEDILQKLL